MRILMGLQDLRIQIRIRILVMITLLRNYLVLLLRQLLRLSLESPI